MNTEALSCPACSSPMLIRSTSGNDVDVCATCEAIWLDKHEFDATVGQRFAGIDVEDLLAMAQQPSLDPRKCPRDGTTMLSVFFQDIELDRCPSCAGIFLDASDRAQLRMKARREAKENAPTDSPVQPRFDAQESIEIEMPERKSPVTVVCGGCGAQVYDITCIRRLDAFWCESCVIAGDFPGSHGVPVQKRLAEATATFAKADAKMAKAREARDLRNRYQDRVVGVPEFSHGEKGRWQLVEYHLLFERLGDAARDMLHRFRKPGPPEE